MAKKEKITELFDNIAPEYDHLNHLLSLNIDTLWRRKAAREITDGSTPLSVRNAIRVCGECIKFRLNDQIIESLQNAHCTTAELAEIERIQA